IGLLLAWLWRIVLIVMLFVRISRLQLLRVPSHPDRVGGLGFLERLPEAFAPVTFALSAMLASHWAHEILYHGRTVDALKLPAAMFSAVRSMRSIPIGKAWLAAIALPMSVPMLA